MANKCIKRFKFRPCSIVLRKRRKINLKRIPAFEVNFVLCLRKQRGDAAKTPEYCMIVCTNKIPLKRYQIFQKYKYLINFDLRGQSAYSLVTSVSLLAGEVQAPEIAPGKFLFLTEWYLRKSHVYLEVRVIICPKFALFIFEK